MRILKALIAVILVLILAFVGIGFLLPREVTVARSVTIDAAPDVVFPQVNSLKAAADWSPWLERDPNVKLTYTGPDAGIGAKLEWASDHPNVGNGSQIIVASVENSSVRTDLDFGDMGTAQAAYLLTDKNGATDITWSLDMDMGLNPIGRWMGLMMDGWVGPDYETGLANLKALVEG